MSVDGVVWLHVTRTYAVDWRLAGPIRFCLWWESSLGSIRPPMIGHQLSAADRSFVRIKEGAIESFVNKDNPSYYIPMSVSL